MRLLTKILSAKLSLRAIVLFVSLSFIAVEMDFDGFIFAKLGINEPRYIDPDVYIYYARFAKFEEQLSTRVTSHRGLNIVLSSSFIGGTNVLALCEKKSLTIKNVIINKNYWDKLNSPSKEILVFHELAHCLYGRAHTYGSIMEPGLLFFTRYLTNYDFYIKELFNPDLKYSEKGETKFQWEDYEKNNQTIDI